MNRLKAIYWIKGKLVIISGLHIGKGKESIDVGGTETPIVKHLHTGQPFIPGSSLKGKLRSLLEWYLGVVKPDKHGQGRPFEGGEEPTFHPIARIFGTPHDKYQGGPTRLIVRDAFLDAQWVENIIDAGFPLTEEKAETAIDRIQGSTLTGSLRQIERVIPGAEFNVEFLYRVYDMQDDGSVDESNFQNFIPIGLKLLAMDGLGGGGSRGNGQIHFKSLTLETITYLQQEGHIREHVEKPKEFVLPHE